MGGGKRLPCLHVLLFFFFFVFFFFCLTLYDVPMYFRSLCHNDLKVVLGLFETSCSNTCMRCHFHLLPCTVSIIIFPHCKNCHSAYHELGPFAWMMKLWTAWLFSWFSIQDKHATSCWKSRVGIAPWKWSITTESITAVIYPQWP